MSVKTLYLIAYNVLQVFLWLYLAWCVFRRVLLNESTTLPLDIYHIQVICTVEIAHGVLGLTRSALMPLVIQQLGRVAILYMQLNNNVFSFDQTHDVSVPLVGSFGVNPARVRLWCEGAFILAEISRYCWYTAALIMSEPPYVLKWLRYSLFIVLYPIGLTCELLTMLLSRDFFDNEAARSVLYVFICLHPLLALLLFSNMLKQRRKHLGVGGGVDMSRKKAH